MKLIECLAEYIKFYRKILITLCYQSSLANLLNFTWKWYRRSISGFTLADLKVHFQSFGKDFVAQLLVSFSLSQQYPLICGFFFYFILVCGRFSTSSFLSFLEWVSLHTLATTIRFWGSTFLLLLTSILLLCIGAHPSSPATGAYSFSKSEMGFYVCAVWCVHRHRTSCFKSHPRRLGNVQ